MICRAIRLNLILLRRVTPAALSSFAAVALCSLPGTHSLWVDLSVMLKLRSGLPRVMRTSPQDVLESTSYSSKRRATTHWLENVVAKHEDVALDSRSVAMRSVFCCDSRRNDLLADR